MLPTVAFVCIELVLDKAAAASNAVDNDLFVGQYAIGPDLIVSAYICLRTRYNWIGIAL